MKKINNVIIMILLIIDAFITINALRIGVYDRIATYVSLILVLLLPRILTKLTILKFTPNLEFIYLLFAILSDFFGAVLNLYNITHGYDSFAHFIFGAYSVVLAIMILLKFNKYEPKYILFTIFIIICISTTMSASWEFIEYALDKILKLNLQHSIDTGVNDTMKDMLIATFGCLLFCIYYYIDLKDKSKLSKFIVAEYKN